jgi:hypothetical protein
MSESAAPDPVVVVRRGATTIGSSCNSPSLLSFACPAGCSYGKL